MTTPTSKEASGFSASTTCRPRQPAPVNTGLAAARGETIGVLLDGARLTSPGILRYALVGSRMHDRSAIITHGWYVGYDYQREAIGAGWTTQSEDAVLLASIDWPNDGYRLFEISTPDDVSLLSGWWEALLEASLLFLPADVWDALSGYDERFDSPGGGLVNLDTLRRAVELEDLGWVILLGEATFHQVHGGIATNVPRTTVDALMDDWMSQYWDLRGQIVEAVGIPEPVFLATFPCGLRARYAAGLNRILYEAGLLDQPVPPPVPLPNPADEPDTVAALWLTKAVEAARRGHETETMTFARWARQAGAALSSVGPLLSHVVAIDASIEKLPAARQAQFHLAAADVFLRVVHCLKPTATFGRRSTPNPSAWRHRPVSPAPAGKRQTPTTSRRSETSWRSPATGHRHGIAPTRSCASASCTRRGPLSRAPTRSSPPTVARGCCGGPSRCAGSTPDDGLAATSDQAPQVAKRELGGHQEGDRTTTGVSRG